MSQVTYNLTGATSFYFPFAIRYDSQLTVELIPGGVVPEASYEVVGSGPRATGVMVLYPDAPLSGQLKITRYTPPVRVSEFSEEQITARALNAEFDNLYQYLIDTLTTDPLTYKGTIDCSDNPNYPAALTGDVYIISVGGKIGGTSGVDVLPGQRIIATNDTVAGDHAAVGDNWGILNVTSISDVALTAQTVGFIATGGTTSRTLTVDVSRTLSDLLQISDIVYTGTYTYNTSFPVGSYVLCVGQALSRNSSNIVRLDDVGQYVISGVGSALTGTWRSRGYIGEGIDAIILFQRVA